MTLSRKDMNIIMSITIDDLLEDLHDHRVAVTADAIAHAWAEAMAR